MERLILTPTTQEITVNAGADEGAVDVFSYDTPDHGPASSLVVIGHRLSDSANMGYMVSLIAALARREYFAQPGQSPKESFTRMLRKLNEVVDEFAKAHGAELSVGVVAITGGTILVSKLDKFKILLAREGQVIDILNNVMLFSKEHVEPKRFSSVISGSVQPGDRLLAFVPSKGITSRERNLKTWLVKLEPDDFIQRIGELGQEHPGWGASFVRVDMLQRPEPATLPVLQIPDLEPRLAASQPAPQQPETTEPVVMPWAPRQQHAMPHATLSANESLPAHAQLAEPEVPHMIATEYSLASRQRPWSRIAGMFKIMRLDNRGKAAVLAGVALLIFGSVIAVKTLFFVDKVEVQLRASLETISTNVRSAHESIDANQSAMARTTLLEAAAGLASLPQEDERVQQLTADVTEALDTIDHAQEADASVAAQPADKQQYVLATWSSQSASLWAVSRGDDASLSLVELADGIPSSHEPLEGIAPDVMVPFLDGVLLMDTASKTIVRSVNGTLSSYTLTTPDTIRDIAVFDGNAYVLTSATILKVSDLDTEKPVVKIWLTDAAEFVPAERLFVDGSIYTLGRDGKLSLYYKGARQSQQSVALAPVGSWRLAGGPDGLLTVANADTRRVHLIALDGSLVRTLKLETQQRIRSVGSGPDNATVMVSDDGRIWTVK